jgi:starch synthase (maltosyl-transferring)
MMDLVINHTAKDSVLVEQHPDGYLRDADGNLVSPGCEEPDGTMVKWEDLAELDYENTAARQGLIAYWRDLVRHYVGLGIRGFRCDAAYQVPVRVWTPLSGRRAELRRMRVRGRDARLHSRTGRGTTAGGILPPLQLRRMVRLQGPYLLEQYELYRKFAPSIAFRRAMTPIVSVTSE